jgi:hypothetical protein
MLMRLQRQLNNLTLWSAKAMSFQHKPKQTQEEQLQSITCVSVRTYKIYNLHDDMRANRMGLFLKC